MSEELRTTALTASHRGRGAKLVDFSGWLMPLEFAGTLAEHRAVRDGVGAFDVSHLGTVWIQGGDAERVVAATFTNDPAALDDGASQYSLCCNDDGGILDDLIVYRLASNRFLVVPNAANTATVVGALERAAEGADARIEDASTDTAIVAVQGPHSLDLVRDALAVDVRAIPYLGLREVDVEVGGGHATVVACRTGYTGEVGCELLVPEDAAVAIWDRLLDGGADPIGLGARDTLRLEMGYPLHGNDIDPTTTPYEARLGWAVKLDRGHFTGQEALRARKDQGPSRRLWGLRGEGRRPPRPGQRVIAAGDEVGTVTSGSFSPVLEVGIGLAYLDAAVTPGDDVVVDVRGREVPFAVARPPFVDRDPKDG